MTALLFDLGNVLLKFDFSKTQRVLRQYGADVERMKGPEMGQLAAAYETGKLSDQAFIEAVAKLTGYQGDEVTFQQGWQDIFEPNEPMMDYLKAQKQRGLPCYLLSNSNGMHVSFIREKYEVLGQFDDIIFSHEAGCMKPDEAIFELAIKRFQLDPERTLYIDDAAANVAAGSRFGLRIHQYDHAKHAAFLTAAAAMGVPLA